MKCPECGHVLVEQAAKFCSNCGCRLAPPQDPNSTGKPPPAPEVEEGCGAQQEIKSESASQHGKAHEVSTKRPNEEPRGNIKNKGSGNKTVQSQTLLLQDVSDMRRKKKSKKKSKKKEGPDSHVSKPMTSDISHTSLQDEKTERQEKVESLEKMESLDSECSDASGVSSIAFEGSSGPSSLTESWIEVSGTDHDVSTLGDKMNSSQTEPAPLLDMPVQRCHAEDSQSSRLQDSQNVKKGTDVLSSKNQTPKATLDAPATPPTDLPIDSRNPTSQIDLEEETQTADRRTDQAHGRVNAAKKDAESSQQPNADQKDDVNRSGGKPSQTRQETKAAEESAGSQTQSARSLQVDLDPVFQKAAASEISMKGTGDADQVMKEADSKPNPSKDAESLQESHTDQNTKTSKPPQQKKKAGQTDTEEKATMIFGPRSKPEVLKKQTESMVSKKGSGDADQVMKEADSKPNPYKKDAESLQESHTDQNTKTSKPPQQKKKAGQTDTEEKGTMIFGPRSKPEAPDTTLRKPQNKQNSDKEKSQGQKSARSKGKSGSPTSQSAETDKEPDEGAKKTNVSLQTSVSPKMEIPVAERLTIYFHAILSKDFKFNPEEDFVYLRAGGPLGSWDFNLIQLHVSRDLGEHGFYVEGKLMTSKSVATSVSIPYKYVVYKQKKKAVEFEFLYKRDVDPANPANRCIFVKPHLLNQEGEWHQYDDIICAEPSTGLFQWLKETFMPDQHKNVVQGRNIAGKIMLETIFDLLSTWSDANLKSFFVQLKQFQEVYANPFVYEEKQKRWGSLGYGDKEVKNLIKEFMVENVLPQLQKESQEKGSFFKDPLKAAVIVLYVIKEYSIKLDHGELSRLCTALCLPKLPKEEFLVYWANLDNWLSVWKNPSEMVLWLINSMIANELQRWVLLVPLLHFLRRTSDPFKPVQLVVNPQYNYSWAGLGGVKIPSYLRSQDRSALMNVMKANIHLVEKDQLLLRSCMAIISLDDLIKFISITPVDLLECLHAFVCKTPVDISYSSYEDVSKILSICQTNLIEHKYSCYTEDYGKECLATAVKLLQKLCKGVKSSYEKLAIPIKCVTLVTSVSDFASAYGMQATEDSCTAQLSSKHIQLLTEAMKIMRSWMSETFRDQLLQKNYSRSLGFSSEIEVWNSVISQSFASEDFTKEWTQTFSTDLEGKLNKEPPLDQVEIYCSKFDEMNNTHPFVAKSIEKCALQAVNSICQGYHLDSTVEVMWKIITWKSDLQESTVNFYRDVGRTKTEEKLFERITISSKFGKLLSVIILKSWPKDSRGINLNGDEVVLRHLLSWAAAKNIFQLHGADEKLMNALSDDAREIIAIAVSSFASIFDQFISGHITIKLLKNILPKKDTFMELIKIDCLTTGPKCKDSSAMKKLLQLRDKEVKDLYHEKHLVQTLVVMCRTLQEYIKVNVDTLEEKLQNDVENMTLDLFMKVHLLDEIPSSESGVVTFFSLNEDMRQMAEILNTVKESCIFKMCWENQAKEWFKIDDDDEEEEVEELEHRELVATIEVIHENIFQPCYERYRWIYTNLKNGDLKLQDVDIIFEAYKGMYEDLTAHLQIMCKIDSSDDGRWIERRTQQIKQYHELHLAVESAQVIMNVKEALSLQGNFQVLQMLLEATHVGFRDERLDRIDNDLMQAKKVLVDITESRRECLQELNIRRSFVMWVKEALEDINELKVFVDLASISAGENDLDVDRVACFHDAILGYSSVLYDLKPEADFQSFQEALKKLWKAYENDPNLPKKLRDSARHLEWLKTVKDSHGSVELSSLSLASAINNKGIYIISAQDHRKLCLETVLKLKIPEEHEEGQEMRCYSLEDLRELQNKLMLISGKGDQGQGEVERFAEVFANVQRLAEAFMNLFTAGNPLFRHWEANVNCSPHSEAGIIMDFSLDGIIRDIMVEGNVEEQLPVLCKKMERCLKFWNNFMDKQRSVHYYLNYYTAEQIVYLCNNLTQQSMSEDLEDQVLMMLSFVKPGCSTLDLKQAWCKLQQEICNEAPKQNEEIDFQTFVEVTESMQTDTNFVEEAHSLYLLSLVDQACGSRKLDLVWNAYMKDMTHFLPDCLDITSLGRLLEILANEDDDMDENDGDFEKQDTTVYRNLPKGFMGGQPNLIICPHAEILLSCISVYMSDEHVPLPTYDEVLLCTASTPYEQAELFLRRCLTVGGHGEKIYTMLYADQLPYEVSYKVEQLFQRLEKQSRKDYRLVIICNSEREHAYLPSAFSQFRLHMIPLEPLDRIQAYLCRHYAVPLEQSSAASVFKKGLCVGIVCSVRAGVGKSLYIRRLYEKLKKTTTKETTMKCIRLIEPRVDENFILKSLLSTPTHAALKIFHFDVTSSVQKGLHEFLFKLLVLGYLMNSEGKMWKCSSQHLYIIEILQSTGNLPKNSSRPNVNFQYAFLDIFPKITCRPPKEVLEIEMRIQNGTAVTESDDPLMDDQEFRSEAFQRPYQYLQRFYNGHSLDSFLYNGVEGTHVECLQMFFVYCGIADPSWAELRNFAWFLNLQLRDCETSVFCDAEFIGDTLQGFKNFVVDFMILMAKDFATPSLSISDQSPGRQQVDFAGVSEDDLAPFRIRKRWEMEPHPYIFFNDDHVSMTFIGFHLQVNQQNMVDAIDPEKGTLIKRNIMTRQLYEGLRLQRVPFNVDFDSLPRAEKIERLCSVLGVQWPLDPDETYELTTDNILKMLAIHMRFRCGIPVILMGETGCGKTRLIKFLCELGRSGVATENMKLVKVHGGTNSEMIYSKVREAQAVAVSNRQKYDFDSVLFFDEANTTEAISSIKEIVCDNTVEGDPLDSGTGLQIIAACNPYRKHTDQMISRLESAGLGYRVRAKETDDKLGSIPLRQLVYRVHALPPSMIPLVWDFGQLNDNTEKMYIQQIVQRMVEANSVSKECIKIIAEVLSSSQKYMRTRRDECSFVSLRDVERCMQTFVWFYKNHIMFLAELKTFLEDKSMVKNAKIQKLSAERDPVQWSLIMAVGVCYHACLEDKQKYRIRICKHLPGLYGNHQNVLQEISLMQDLLLSGVPLGKTIAKNNALKENVFMMVICIELRIPLFLVGKPGSSKSLSKTLVADAMQGQAAHSELYKKLKQIHLVSFQCSPHSTPEGIINTFKQCARFQEGKNLMEYTSVVVLDEIGLAEDSPKMPLKTLHPLLEEGCIDDKPLPHKKVGFIGISNWALDPAKMNRGIFVSRGDPDEKELISSAKGICSSDQMIQEKVCDLFQPFARAYLNISKRQGKGFFGLRDYYSLIKMVFAVTRTSKQKPTVKQIMEAVLRNFSGRDDIDAVQLFTTRLNVHTSPENISKIDLVRQNISSVGQDDDCRYLLVLTKNYAALQIIQQTFFSESCQPEIIFGSSFPKDQEYTQICRNINRVKICMETGQTIVLLNLQNLYESLYDALNQYYVSLGGQKYVDLGLGTHRVKCRVHKDFRLIVIEEKEVVYKQFPIPLINRLEKHYLDINTVLRSEQKEIVKELEKWVELFVTLNNRDMTYKYIPADVFIGYHSDTCATVVLQVTERLNEEPELFDVQKKVLDQAKLILLNCATPDSVVRLDCTKLPRVETEELTRMYFEEQKHCSLAEFILSHRWVEDRSNASFTEVTTFSRLLTASDIGQLQQTGDSVELLSLQQFDTEHSFLKKIRQFLVSNYGNKILIVQTEFEEGSLSTNLIASAKYCAMNEINKSREEEGAGRVFVYFITKLPRIGGGTSYVGFHGGPWTSVHIDDLRESTHIVADFKALRVLTISQLFEEKSPMPELMEVEDTYTKKEQTEIAQDMYMEVEQTETLQDMYVGAEHTEATQDMHAEQAEADQDLYTEANQLETEAVEHKGLETMLDTASLVRSSVQSAVGMLRDQVDDGTRSTKRVEILLTLLGDSDELKAVFLKTVKKRLHLLLRMHDEKSFAPKNWVFKEASNVDALQEGGTFRHTLWKRIQTVLIPFLAQLISVIDCDCNLDLLLDANSGEALKRLWLDIFANEKLLVIPYGNVDSSSQAKTILVPSYIMADSNIGCSMPFSWKIKDHLDELWVYARQREGQTMAQFEEFFTKTPLGRYIAVADKEMHQEFFQRYLQDYISMIMKVTTEEQLQLLRVALACCVNELRGRLEADRDEIPTLPWVHAAYEEFKNRLQNFSRILTIEPKIAQALLNNQCSTVGSELELDVYAARASVEYLEPLELDTDNKRLAWLRQVKRLQVPIELVCSEENLAHCGQRSKEMVRFVRNGWNRIFSLSLFVEHMLVGIEQLERKLQPVVLAHTRRLGMVLQQNSDLKANITFENVIEVLKACKDRAGEQIFRFGFQPCPVCLGDPRDPISLVCEHIYCLSCIKQWCLNPGQRMCPMCKQEIPDDFDFKVSEDVRVLICQNAQFRNQCNAFFIDLVTTACFKDNTPPSHDIILHLLSFLMVDVNVLTSLIRGRPLLLTKALSPFNDSVDQNPVVRSVILKLLLKYSFENIKDYLQMHLAAIEKNNILDEKDKTELYSLYINCLEDSMFEKMQRQTITEQLVHLQDEKKFLCRFLQSQCKSPATATIEYLQQIARVRLLLDLAAHLLGERWTGSAANVELQTAVPPFLESVEHLCGTSGNDWYRIYLIRKVCSQHGVDFVHKLLRMPNLEWLFPEELRLQDETSVQMDQFLVHGEQYKLVRETLAKAIIEGKMEGIDEACARCECFPPKKILYLLLALFREVTCLYKAANPTVHPKLQQCKALEEFIQNSRMLVRPELKAFATALVCNQLGSLHVQSVTPDLGHVVTELTIHLAAVLHCGNSWVLSPLQLLAQDPAKMQRAFLPTMPEDMLAVAHKVLPELSWYSCPNGHYCTIGECGRPMEKGRCLDCGAEIGGQNHLPVPGFAMTNVQGDRTQTGHILGDPKRRDNPDMLDTKNMSLGPFTIIRLLTHMAMLLGANSHQQDIINIIKPQVQNPQAFLMEHILKDLEQLTKTLGNGVDGTIGAIHLTLRRLMEPYQPSQWPALYDNTLSKKEARNSWEMAIAADIITPQLRNLEHELKEMNTLIRTDLRVSANPILKVVFGDPRLFLTTLPKDHLIHGPAVWSCRERVSLVSLAYIVEQNNGKETVPLLWRFLQKEVELRLVRFLPDILALQMDLVKKFQNVTDLPYMTIDDFLREQKSDPLRAWYEGKIRIFLTTWNQLRLSLATNGELKLPAEFCREDLDLHSDLRILLPQRQGKGLCSTSLVSYLIALHNDIIYTVDKHTGEETSYTVSPGDLTDLHVIRYELERDLIPLVLSNCQYSMERGQETLMEYDLPKIQQKILTRFLQGKPLITLTGIPTLVNRHDRNYENIFKDVKRKVGRESLTSLVLTAMAGELPSYSDVCDALTVIEVALGFLAMTGGEPHMQLIRYLEDVLQMGDQIAPYILKALSRCSLKHCVALWQFLTSLKSETMLRLKRDPFSGIPEEFKKFMSDQEQQLLKDFLTKGNVDVWLLESHEFLLLALKNPHSAETYKPNWSLKHTLVSYMERKDCDIPADLEEFFPDEICLSHFVDAWKMAVTFKQERSLK